MGVNKVSSTVLYVCIGTNVAILVSGTEPINMQYFLSRELSPKHASKGLKYIGIHPETCKATLARTFKSFAFQVHKKKKSRRPQIEKDVRDHIYSVNL